MDDTERLAKIEEQLKTMPETPGVYVIHDESDDVIYVGKAKSLINRLRQHFAPSTDFSKSRVIREQAVRIEVHEVRSENEALLLEYNMIQEHQPPLNERWKDGKTYPYLEITTGEEFPRIQLTRERTNEDSIYLGPYSDVGAVKRSVKYVLQLFPMADCRKEIHLGDADGWAKTCIRRRTQQCLRPCEQAMDPADYRVAVDRVVAFLDGKLPSVVDDLEQRMQTASKQLEFEEAAKFRDTIKSITRTMQQQQVMMDGIEDCYTVISIAHNGEFCVAIQKVEAGRIVRQEATSIPLVELKDSSKETYIMNFLYSMLELHDHTDYGGMLMVVATVPYRYIMDTLTEFGFKTRPKEGPMDEQLIELTKQHAKKYLHRKTQLKRNTGIPTARILDLQEILQLEDPPLIIDCFDISTLLGNNNVASCIRFVNGKPEKAGYRRFKIKTVVGQDDFASMHEAVFRRYRDIHDGLDPKGFPVPDLIVIDGGSEQLKRAFIALQELGHSIPVIGLAKREEEIYQVGKEQPLALKKNRPGLLLIRSARDEAHRFAIKYQRELRQKEGLKSILDAVDGIGPKRKAKLLKKYHTVGTMASQSSETISREIGITKELASQVIAEARSFLSVNRTIFTPKN